MLVPSLRGLTKAAAVDQWRINSQIPMRAGIGGLGGAALGGGLGYMLSDEEDRKRNALLGAGGLGLLGAGVGGYSGHRQDQVSQDFVDLLNKAQKEHPSLSSITDPNSYEDKRIWNEIALERARKQQELLSDLGGKVRRIPGSLESV